jgi:hypothetical protein
MPNSNYPLSSPPAMKIGMGDKAAKHSGYVHGYQTFVTKNICSLTVGTSEFIHWMKGYEEGSDDAYNDYLTWLSETNKK